MWHICHCVIYVYHGGSYLENECIPKDYMREEALLTRGNYQSCKYEMNGNAQNPKQARVLRVDYSSSSGVRISDSVPSRFYFLQRCCDVKQKSQGQVLLNYREGKILRCGEWPGMAKRQKIPDHPSSTERHYTLYFTRLCMTIQGLED